MVGKFPLNIRRALARVTNALSVLTDRKRPWRKSLVTLRVTNSISLGEAKNLSAKIDTSFQNNFSKHPESVTPYLRYLVKYRGESLALAFANELADVHSDSAPVLTEVAHFLYGRGRRALGDRHLAKAQTVNPDYLPAYAEAAWNQRSRGNLYREQVAVDRCIELTRNTVAEFDWTLWRGETLVRLSQFEAAWEDFRDFTSLTKHDRRLLSIGYCAWKLGLQDEMYRAYRQYLGKRKKFDPTRIANDQVRKYSRVDHAQYLLDKFPMTGSDPAELTIRYVIGVRSSDESSALEALKELFHLGGRPRWAAQTYPNFLEILGKRGEALSAYKLLKTKEHNSRTRHRLATLLKEESQLDKICELVIDQLVPARKRELSALQSVDPKGKELLSDIQRLREPSEIIKALTELQLRVHDSQSIRVLNYELARILRQNSRTNEAVDALLSASSDRLPSVTLRTNAERSPIFSITTHYAEYRESCPVNENTVLYESAMGGNTSGNPLAMCLYLLEHHGNESLLHVWSINDDAPIHRALLSRPNIVFVRKGSTSHIRHLATAKYVINDSTTETYFEKRKNQRVLNTWHGTPWKTLGKDQRSEPFAYGNIARSFMNSDLVLTPNAHTRQVLCQSMDLDVVCSKKFVSSGYPRISLSLNLDNTEKRELRSRLHLDAGQKLVVFLPTWKGTIDNRDAEVEKTLHIARSLNASDRVVLLRAHQYVANAFRRTNKVGDDVTLAPLSMDTNEIIAIADVVVTDYSSVLFDSAAIDTPVVKFLSDVEDYQSSRGLYFSPEEVPGVNVYSLDDLSHEVKAAIANPRKFTERYSDLTAKFTPHENASSSEQVWRLLTSGLPKELESNQKVTKNSPRTILMTTGGLPQNGITRALRSLTTSLKNREVIPHLSLSSNSFETGDVETVTELLENCKILPSLGRRVGTSFEQEVHEFYSTPYFRPTPDLLSYLSSGRKRQSRRLFGDVQFNSAVEYSGYDSSELALICLGTTSHARRRGVIFHSEMHKEIATKFPKLQSEMYVLNSADFVASVSEGVRDAHIKHLGALYGVKPDLQITLGNTLNAKTIVHKSLEPLDPEFRSWYERPGKHVVMLGRLSYEKNHAMFYQALAAIRNRIDVPISISVMGDGLLRAELLDQIAQLGLSDVVRLWGPVSNPYPHFRYVDAMFLPSSHEGQPIVILESLTLGTPVVVTDIPGSRSTVEDGKFGTIVELSQQGIEDGLLKIVNGTLKSANHFDAQEFSRSATTQFMRSVLDS